MNMREKGRKTIEKRPDGGKSVLGSIRPTVGGFVHTPGCGVSRKCCLLKVQEVETANAKISKSLSSASNQGWSKRLF